MEECDPYSEESSTSWFSILLYFIFIVTLFFDTYLIYAIIFRSSKQMSTYKWHLLFHQTVATTADITFNFIGRPVIFIPFAMGYPASVFRGIIPSHYLAVAANTLIAFSLSTVLQLSISRYLIINGHTNFPWKHRIIVASLYLGVGVLCVQLGRSHADEKEIVERLSQQYSCITSDLFNIPAFIIYDNQIIVENTMAIMAINFLGGSSAMVYFVVMSYRGINVVQMSPQLARLQRKLIFILILQIVIPGCILCIPVAIYQFFIIFKILNAGTVVGHLLITAMSMFSTTGGVPLLFMISEYNFFKRKTKAVPVEAIPSSMLISSQVE